MEKATSSLRRGSALLLSIGTGYQELNLIISELKNLKSHAKAIKDSQATVFQDMTNWACTDESVAIKELFINLLDLNALWCETQSQFADSVSEFRHQFEMILEGEKYIDAARSKFADCEIAEQKAKKKLKKLQKREGSGDMSTIATKIAECERQREVAQAEVSQKIKENEAAKLVRVKEGLIKMAEAYLALSHKCIYIFEAQRDVAKCLPDLEDRNMCDVRFNGLLGAKEILMRARVRVKQYKNRMSNQMIPRQRNLDPPPPYSPSPYYPNPPCNPFYLEPEYQEAAATATTATVVAATTEAAGPTEAAATTQAAIANNPEETNQYKGGNDQPKESSSNAETEEIAGAMSNVTI